MTMSADTLATELEAMVPVDTIELGADNFSMAWENYFSESLCGAFPVTGSLSAATAALKGAMVPILATPGAAMSAIQAGITAFWGVVASSAPAIWITVPPLTGATPPTTLGAISATLVPVGTANTSAALSLEDSMAAIAAALHPLNLGGTGIIPTGTLPIT